MEERRLGPVGGLGTWDEGARAQLVELEPLRPFGETWAQALLEWVAAGSPPWSGREERALVERLAG